METHLPPMHRWVCPQLHERRLIMATTTQIASATIELIKKIANQALILASLHTVGKTTGAVRVTSVLM